METNNHIKSFNWKNGSNTNSTNRIRFASAKERARRATADVYRAYKRHSGTSASREERVHTLDLKTSQRKKKRRVGDKDEKIIKVVDSDGDDNIEEDDLETTFSSELDLAQDRNASGQFSAFYREIWPMTRSLPELLHHIDSVIDCLMSHMLTRKTCPSDENDPASKKITGYVVNYATKDILHLLAVIARDLRHEIHPCIYSRILPRITMDLLNPPSSEAWARQNNIQGYTVDVEVVEMAFRTLSYCFRYDSDRLLGNKRTEMKEKKSKRKGTDKSAEKDSEDVCLEQMRKFYGATLAHKRECVRRLAAESFAPLVQKLKTKEKKRHLKRVIRALATACSDKKNQDNNDNTSNATTQVQRARSDALDGISLLLFSMSKGIPGRLHSKGQDILATVLECITSPGTSTSNQSQKQEIVSSLASQYLLYLCQHVNSQHFSPIWDELHKAMKVSIESISIYNNNNNSKDKTSNISDNEQEYRTVSDAIGHIAQLLATCVSFKKGALCRDNQHMESEHLSSSLLNLFESGCYWNIPSYSTNHYFMQKSILQLLCTSWTLYPNDPSFASKLPHFFPLIIDAKYDEKKNESGKVDRSFDPALVLGRNLLPHLPPKVIMKTLAPSILAAATRQLDSSNNSDGALILLQLVATMQTSSSESLTHLEDPENEQNIEDDWQEFCQLFYVDHAKDCFIPQSHRDALLDMCLSFTIEKLLNETKEVIDFARLSFVVRCVPFLTFISCDESESKSSSASVEKKVLKWMSTVLKQIDKCIENKDDQIHHSKYIVTKALLLEALSITCIKSIQQKFTPDEIEKFHAKAFLEKNQKSAYNFLIENSDSVWVLKSVSSFVGALKKVSLSHIGEVSSTPDEIFDALNPNLRCESHVIRMCTLKILNSLPKKLFVLDHADLDLSEDLDEEPSSKPVSFEEENEKSAEKDAGSGSASSFFSGSCNLISTLLSIECLPITLQNERQLVSKLNRVEVLSRSGKLPIVYTEAAANFMFGVLHMKFSPLWPAAIRAMVELSKCLAAGSDDSVLWPPLMAKLEEVTVADISDIYAPTRENKDDMGWYSHNEYYSFSSSVITDHLATCMSFQQSGGLDRNIFQCNDDEKRPDAARYLSTDSATYFQSVWSVMEDVPHLTIKKSRMIVPLFLEFLHFQYYGEGSEEPDAKELCLTDHIDIISMNRSWSSTNLGKKSNNRKLSSFLKMFSAVNGPQQLFKHKFLEKVFIMLLSNGEVSIAQLGLSCLKKFKHSYLLPYTDSLSQMLIKGELRETLTKVDMSKINGTIDSHHRSQLIPIISRILFGRLTARGMGSKSSKDTPAARRAAILSFFSSLDQNMNELDFFVYFMVRIFIPPHISIKITDVNQKSSEQESNTRLYDLICATANVTVEDISKLAVSKVIGFLNLTNDVISKIGYGIDKFIPVFYSILITLCQFSEVDSADLDERNESTGDVDTSFEANESTNKNDKNSRISSVRSLCFRSLSRLFGQFSSSFDFTPNSSRLWKHLHSAILKLPSSSINAEKPSSLLLLLENISSHQNLLPMLQECSVVVQSVIKCISVNVKIHVLDVSLKFIENLLTEGGKFSDAIDESFDKKDHIGIKILEPHIHLLIRQFTQRIGSSGDSTTTNDDSNIEKQKQPKAITLQTNKVARRELSILCRISNILVDKDSETEENTKTLETLCGLLLSSLKLDRGVDELIQLNVLGILKSLIPRLSSNIALTYLTSLSKLLGPNKSKPGITSPQIRQMIVSVIDLISSSDNAQVCHKYVSKTLKDLNAMDSRYIMEFDFEKIVPALNQLGYDMDETGSWYSLSKTSESSGSDPKALIPLIYHCLHSLYDSDGVINRGAFKALRTCVYIAGKCAKVKKIENTQAKNEMSHDPWQNLIEKTLVPNINICLTSNDETVRRYLILLISDISRSFAHSTSLNLYKDLYVLVRNDDPEQDFFLNITHVQIHRRCRAFASLRKYLSIQQQESMEVISSHEFSQQSLSNILIRIALHPILECNKQSEETYVLEAVATIGSIAKRLQWNKYYSLLLTLLTQIARKPNQERYLIGAICSVTDAFHFDVIVGDTSNTSAEEGKSNADQDKEVSTLESDKNTDDKGNTVWRALNNKIIPQLEGNLSKEISSKDGSRLKVLRPPVVLALTKLLQKLPVAVFERKLPRLLLLICDTLKSRDSNVRDMSRETLSKMTIILDLKYLSDIIQQLAVSLSDGYQLHVRSKTLHTIMLRISKEYLGEKSGSTNKPLSLPFDRCVPALMDLIQQDLFGTASEMKEAQDVQKRVIKEAVGVKSYDTLEIVCKLITFSPSASNSGHNIETSSTVHVVVRPLLERLRLPDIDFATVGKIRECLNRVVIGISHNPSAEARELMSFIYGCIAPFMGVENQHEQDFSSDDEDDSENEEENFIKVSGKDHNLEQGKPKQKSTAVVNWVPSSLQSAPDKKTAQSMKKLEKKDLHRVQDGANAPKLTGKSRYGATKAVASKSLNDPAKASGVIFGLSLLHSCMKRTKLDNKSDGILAMADPFIWILTRCIRTCSNNEITLLALKCLGFLLRWDLPSVNRYSKRLGSYTLLLLTTSGSSSNTRHEITQGCFKILTFLIKSTKESNSNNNQTTNSYLDVVGKESQTNESEKQLLNGEQMESLISLLHTTVTDSEHQNATFGLIKAIASTRYLSAEFYDLMEKILKLSVQSHKETVRQQSSMIFVQFLIDYPLGKKRFEDHMKQIVLNIKYEYEDGRMSAIGLLSVVIEKLPSSLLEDQAQLFFLPLVLQLVNDESEKCREAVSKTISSIFQRVSMETLQTLYDYIVRWFSENQSGISGIQRTSAQLLGIMVESRSDFIKRGNHAKDQISILQKVLDAELDNVLEDSDVIGNEWELVYFCLICFEKIHRVMPNTTNTQRAMWSTVIKCLVHPHLWIKQVASRIISTHILGLDPTALSFDKESEVSFICSIPGSIHDIAKNICRQIDAPADQLTSGLSTLAVKTLTWAVQAMYFNPKLCYKDDISIENTGTEGMEKKSKDPVLWLMNRLSNMAKDKGELRREAVFKCFAAFASSCDKQIVTPYLEQMLIPLHRALLEAQNLIDQKRARDDDPDTSALDLLKDVMQVLEDQCGTEQFISAYTAVKTRAKERRDQRKQEVASQAIHNPEEAAKRKIKKQERERERKKRRMQEKKLGIHKRRKKR